MLVKLGVEMNAKKLLKGNISEFGDNFECENVVIESFQKQISRDRFRKFSDLIRQRN